MNHGEDRVFLNRKPISLGLSGPDFDGSEAPGMNVIHERIPDWLTMKVSSDILYTINCWSYASTTRNLVIYIPLHWVASVDRYKYRYAQLFGHPLMLNEYAREPQVAVTIKERPAR